MAAKKVAKAATKPPKIAVEQAWTSDKEGTIYSTIEVAAETDNPREVTKPKAARPRASIYNVTTGANQMRAESTPTTELWQ